MPPLAAVRLACLKDALAAVAVWLPHDLSGILKALQVAAGSMQAPSQCSREAGPGYSSNASRIKVIRAEHGHAVSCAGLRS